MTAATFVIGTPPRPTTSTLSTPPAASGATEGTPLAVRVSRIREGARERYWPSQPAGVTAFDPPDWLAPTPFDAVTLKEYEVPLVNPLTIAHGCEPTTVAARPPGDEMT